MPEVVKNNTLKKEPSNKLEEKLQAVVTFVVNKGILQLPAIRDKDETINKKINSYKLQHWRQQKQIH